MPPCWLSRVLQSEEPVHLLPVHTCDQLQGLAGQRAALLLQVSSFLLLPRLSSLHPGVRQDLLQRRSLLGPVRQTPANQRLAFWEEKGRAEVRPGCGLTRQSQSDFSGGRGLCSPVETRLVKMGVALTISWSHSNGMSPQTMSKSNTPRDQTVRETAS